MATKNYELWSCLGWASGWSGLIMPSSGKCPPTSAMTRAVEISEKRGTMVQTAERTTVGQGLVGQEAFRSKESPEPPTLPGRFTPVRIHRKVFTVPWKQWVSSHIIIVIIVLGLSLGIVGDLLDYWSSLAISGYSWLSVVIDACYWWLMLAIFLGVLVVNSVHVGWSGPQTYLKHQTECWVNDCVNEHCKWVHGVSWCKKGPWWVLKWVHDGAILLRWWCKFTNSG